MKQAEKIRSKIQTIVADKSQVSATYRVTDESVQTELRLRAQWSIRLVVDTINYPKELNPEHTHRELWSHMARIDHEIKKLAVLADCEIYRIIPINARRKNGEALRAAAKQAWEIETGKQFLAEYRAVTKKSRITAIRKQIAALQAEQKIIIPQLRDFNSQYIAARKQQTAELARKNAELARKNAEAIASGRFWEADKKTLKNYFNPPFDRNYLADVSGTWRAALYTEMGSTAYKSWRGGWRHKNIGTGRAYLCGIDDNGDEWGYQINLSDYMHLDAYSDMGYAGVSVEDAMSELFGLPYSGDNNHEFLAQCTRQGDLLFYRDPRITDDLHPHEGPYHIRESHEILSTGLMVNGGQYFASNNPIYVRHTSHPIQILPPGKYRLYTLQIADAD